MGAKACPVFITFIRLRRKPSRLVGMDECVKNRPKMKYCCYLPALRLRQTGGGCRQLRITLRSHADTLIVLWQTGLGVGGYFMEVPRALPVPALRSAFRHAGVGLHKLGRLFGVRSISGKRIIIWLVIGGQPYDPTWGHR